MRSDFSLFLCSVFVVLFVRIVGYELQSHAARQILFSIHIHHDKSQKWEVGHLEISSESFVPHAEGSFECVFLCAGVNSRSSQHGLHGGFLGFAHIGICYFARHLTNQWDKEAKAKKPSYVVPALHKDWTKHSSEMNGVKQHCDTSTGVPDVWRHRNPIHGG